MNFKSLNKSLNKIIVIFSLIITIIFFSWIILFLFPNQDGNIFIKNLFYDWLFSKNQVLKIMKIFAPFLLGSLAVLICYKTGIINLSVSGQMALSGMTIFFIGDYLKSYSVEINWLPILIFVGILSAVCLSLLIGFLKIFFNINEVLSGIFFNFVIKYFFLFAVKQDHILDKTDKLSTANSLGYSIQFNFDLFEIIPFSLILSFLIFFFISYLLMKTNYGLKLKLIKKYKKAAIYTGINYNKNILKIFLISGIISGIAGIFYYFRNIENTKLMIEDSLPNNGFDTIIIVWLSQYSIIGLIFNSFLLSVIRSQEITIPISHFDPQILGFILGLTLLFVSIFSKLIFNKELKQKIKDFIFLYNQKYKKKKKKEKKIKKGVFEKKC